jgi:uncharacterized protein
LAEDDLSLQQGFAEDAVSRAYYSMFLAAKAVLLPRAKRLNVRKDVAAKFRELMIDTGRVPRRYFDYLDGGEKLRRIADYETDLVSTVSADDAKDVVRRRASSSKWPKTFSRGSGGESENP